MTQLTPFRNTAGRQAVRRHEAEAGAGLHAGPPARGGAARRAHHRGRSGEPPRVLEAALALPRERHHHPDEHAVPRRSRALSRAWRWCTTVGRWRSMRRAACARRCPGLWLEGFPPRRASRARSAARRRRTCTWRCSASGCTCGCPTPASDEAAHQAAAGARRRAPGCRPSTGGSSRPRSKTCSSPGSPTLDPPASRSEPRS